MTRSGLLNGVAALVCCLVLISGATAEPTVGWRNDGSGRYPDATPPVEWSAESNIRWKTELPGRSYGSPIVVGSQIFVVSDPAEFLCIRAADGEILWQQSAGHLELFGEKKAQEVLDAFAKLEETKRELQREYSTLRKDEATPKEKLDQQRDKIKALDEEVTDLKGRWPPPPNRGGAGNTAATPVSDGKYLYTIFGTGIVAAHALDGPRRWIKFVDTPNIGFGQGSSPLLVEGKLIVHIKDLVALDAADGKELWRVELRARHASPLVARVGNTTVLITQGALVRASDGALLVSEKALNVSEASPILEGNRVFAQTGRTTALKLPAELSEPLELEKLWDSQPASGRRTPSPVYHDGLIYGVTTNGILDVTDAETGKSVYRKRLDIGNVYSSPTVAGNLLYLSSTRGVTIVLKPDRKYIERARNQLESFGSCPVFDGKQLYIRAQKYLYCIEAKE